MLMFMNLQIIKSFDWSEFIYMYLLLLNHHDNPLHPVHHLRTQI